MCGIAGIWNFKGVLDRVLLEKMKNTLKHRGPDDSGIYVDSDNKIGLAHTRLSIIDISEKAHQPMVDKESGLVIVYNGEVYNYKELKEGLEAKGYEFKSNSDTEVILKSYLCWGEDCISRFRGMFAFCILDRRNKRFFVARDRFGIKPLNYYKDDHKFIFGSEIKAILEASVSADKDFHIASKFLFSGYIVAPDTIYKNIHSLEPSYYLLVEDNKVRKQRYCDLTGLFTVENTNNISYQDAVKVTEGALLDSVRAHLVSDIEVGVFLSGGVDSSALVSFIKRAHHRKIKTVSVVFPDNQELDESFYARAVAGKFKTQHTEVAVNGRDFMRHIDDIFDAMDQPSVDGVNVYFISMAAKQAGLKAVLSGVGGDELFGGYPSFHNVHKLYRFVKALRCLPILNYLPLSVIPQRHRYKVTHLIEQNNLSVEGTYLTYRAIFTPAQIKDVMNADFLEDRIPAGHIHKDSIHNKFGQISFLEMNNYMINQLLRDADVFSMAHSVEFRVPFIDQMLIGQVNRIPSRYKVGSLHKKLLIDAAGDLPSCVYKRRKMGFTFPLDIWLKNELKSVVEEELCSSEIFNRVSVEKLLSAFYSGRLHWSRIWTLFVLNRFFK